uniref:Variant surface glycoprotein 1070 n=1 Tax=Trypanosoma brucei TaxID=5691 RepID=M4TAP8_9TRYP|nr:variant surface glycoprotein 1070 [Trypanosoma brucei]
MLARTAVILLISLANLVSCGDIGAGANRDVHTALCAFVSMAGGTVEIPQVPSLAQADYDSIQTLNFSTSTDAWQSMFYSDAKRTEVHETDTKAKQEGKEYAEFWSDWTATATKAAAERSDSKSKITVAGAMDAVAKRLAHAKIAGIADEARKIKQRFTVLPPELGAITASTAAATLAKAAFGAQCVTSDTVTDSQPFGAANSGNRNTNCEPGTPNPKPISALGTLACTCLKANANNPTGVCTEKADGGGTWQKNGGGVPSQADFRTLAKTCGSGKNKKITFQDIQQAISRLAGLLHTDETDGYLGAFVASGCTGSSGEGICVKFPGYYADSNKGVQKLQWVQQLGTLAGQLKQIEEKRQEAEEVNKILKSKAAAAQSAIEEAKATANTIKSSEARDTQQEKIEQRNKCTPQNKTPAECPSSHCTYNEKATDGNKCKPKVGSETTAAGTGRAVTNVESKMCSNKKNKRNANLRIANGKVKLARITVFL